jgi:hypothetical protein
VFSDDVRSLRPPLAPHGGTAPAATAVWAPLAGAPRAGAAGPPTSGAAADAAWAAQLRDYTAAAASSAQPLDAVLFNWFGVCGVHLAESLNIPCVGLWPGAPLTRTRAFPCPLLPASAVPAPAGCAPPATSSAEGGERALKSYILWEALLWRSAAAPLNAWRTHTLRLAALPSDGCGHYALMAQRRVPILYGFSSAVLPPPGDWPARVLTTGAWARDVASESGWAPQARLKAFLERPGAFLCLRVCSRAGDAKRHERGA